MPDVFYKIYLKLKNNSEVFAICLTTLITGLVAFNLLNLKFNEDISKFVPKNSQNQKLQKILSSIKFDDKIVLNFYVEDKEQLNDLTGFAKKYVDILSAHKTYHIKSIQGYIEDENAIELLDFAHNYAPFLLNEENYLELKKIANDSSIKSLTEENYRSIISPSGLIVKDLILKDPLKISYLALQNLTPNSSDNFELKDNFLVTKDQKSLLLFITTSPETNSAEFIEYLKNLKTEISAKDKHKVNLDLFGGPIIAAENARQIKRDILLSLGIAFSLLMLIFIAYYKTIFTPFILVLPTIIGGLFGLSLLLIIRDEISAISIGIGSVLLGVTFDYSIHILTHIRKEQSINEMYKSVAKPILMSSATTSLAFLCLVFIDSQALQDLGIFACCSVLGASVAALIIIPLIYKVEKAKPTISKEGSHHKDNLLERISGFDFQNSKPLIALLTLTIVLSSFYYNKVGFNNDLADLNYYPSDLKDIEYKLDTLINSSSKTLYIATLEKDFQSALETNDSVYSLLKNLKDQDKVKSINSLSTFIKSDKNQNRQIENWNKFWTPTKKEDVQKSLVNSGNEFGFKEDAFGQFYQYLDTPVNSVDLSEFDGLSAIKLDDFYTINTDNAVISTIIKVDEQKVESVKTALDNSKNVYVIDRKAINENMLANLKVEFNDLLLYCILVVLGFLLLIYRNFKLGLVTFLPILLTWFITIGVMGFAGLQFNIFNIIISSFIFGLGIDYSIFITNGLVSRDKIGKDGFKTYRTSIILSAITTVVGLGALLFAKHPALNSISLISIIGIMVAMFIAFVLQPLLYNLIVNKKLWVK